MVDKVVERCSIKINVDTYHVSLEVYDVKRTTPSDTII